MIPYSFWDYIRQNTWFRTFSDIIYAKIRDSVHLPTLYTPKSVRCTVRNKKKLRIMSCSGKKVSFVPRAWIAAILLWTSAHTKNPPRLRLGRFFWVASVHNKTAIRALGTKLLYESGTPKKWDYGPRVIIYRLQYQKGTPKTRDYELDGKKK